MNSVRLRDIMSGSERSAGAAAARAAMATLEPAYRFAVAARNGMFDLGLRRPVRLPMPVVSVGNLTTGGVGKTPMVAMLARRLVDMGRSPAVLLRGYRAIDGISDEAVLLAEELGPAVPVEANPDRVAAAREVLARDSGVDVLLLDDGFQHRQVARDLDIVLVDATEPFGFGHVLPRGLLREPARAIRRADTAIVTRADQVDAEALEDLDRTIERLGGRRPVAHAVCDWTELVDQNDQTQPPDVLAKSRVLAVAGIGNTAAFVRSVERHAGALVGELEYPDHHAYSRGDVDHVLTRARQVGAEAVLTTAKDWVKWRGIGWPAEVGLPAYRPTMRIELVDGADEVARLLEQATAAAPRSEPGGPTPRPRMD